MRCATDGSCNKKDALCIGLGPGPERDVWSVVVEGWEETVDKNGWCSAAEPFSREVEKRVLGVKGELSYA
jgi:hypothetical protein